MSNTKTPATEYVLVRGPRGGGTVSVKVLHNFGKGFDFAAYSFWRMSPRAETQMEEWVPTTELELYERSYGNNQGTLWS